MPTAWRRWHAAFKHYRLVDALPKNNYGKVLKTELRARLASRASSGGACSGLKGTGGRPAPVCENSRFTQTTTSTNMTTQAPVATVADIRKTFLDFFASKGHTVGRVQSAGARQRPR